MRLADVIRTHREPIVVEWDAFARTCAPASGLMDVAGLCDHADAILTTFAADLATPQGERAQIEESEGRPRAEDADDTAAGEHGAGRGIPSPGTN